MQQEMLHIPTVSPRPLDSTDRLCRKYFRGYGKRAALEAEEDLLQQARACGITDIANYLDECFTHGRLVDRYATSV